MLVESTDSLFSVGKGAEFEDPSENTVPDEDAAEVGTVLPAPKLNPAAFEVSFFSAANDASFVPKENPVPDNDAAGA